MPKAALPESGEIYSLYASGQLDPAFALLLETQAHLRPDTARALGNAEILAGTFLEQEPKAPLSATAMQTAMDLIDAYEADHQNNVSAIHQASSAIDELLALPEPLRDRVLSASEDREWQTLTKGVRRLALDTGSSAETELYRIEPGQTLPRHSHKASEITLVVTGAYSDETGHYGAGDLSLKGPKDMHQPIADDGDVCFALSVRDGGLKFTGLLGLAQRMVGH